MRRFVFILFFACFSSAVLAQPALRDSLTNIIDKRPGDTIEVRALDYMIVEYLRSDLDKAKKLAWRLKSLSAKINSEFGTVSAYTDLMNIYLSLSNGDSAEYYVKKLERLDSESSREKTHSAYAHAAGLFYRNTGRYKEALPFLLEALRLIPADGDKTQRAGQMLNIANNYHNLSQFENATKYYLESLALFEEVGNKRGQSFCLQGFGNTYKELKQYKISESYYLRSEKMKEELGDKRGLLSAWMSLGSLYQDMGQYDRSLTYANKGLASSREMKIPDQEMKFLFNKASVMLSMKNHKEARANYNESLKLAKTSGDKAFITRIETDLIMIDTDTKKMVNDERELINHLRIAIENGDRELTSEGHEKLAEWYSRHGRFEDAYKHMQLSYNLSDSLVNASVQTQIKKIEEEYLGEKKDREIALLRKDQELRSVELSRQNTMITAVLIALASVVIVSLVLVNRYRVVNRSKRALEIERVRNSIARDLHDEMGSALSSINILSKVALAENETVARQYLQNIGDQSEKMMENMGDMVWSINPRNDNLENTVTRMREFATEILEAANIDFTFTQALPAGVSIDTDKRKNLFMIFKEAVNNAAKYSHATRMEIGVAIENSHLVLTVKDNGKGFDEKIERAGNGLRNMRERAQESAGVISIESKPGTGTEIRLRMRIA